MASFRAENIESDGEADEEIDNTKEIQIEDALKIYQDALKFHSSGETSYKEAGEAYEELFKSEIFKYPESQSEYKQGELFGEQIISPTRLESILPIVDGTNVENAPSTLPQILHLSYKNRGRYHIDALLASLKNSRQEEISGTQVDEASSKALNDFTDALDKDEGDLDLWRRTAKISQVLGSNRVSRYCLEAALDKDEEGADALLGYPGIELNLAADDLRLLERRIDDQLSLKQRLSWKESTRQLPAAWKSHLEIYPSLPGRQVPGSYQTSSKETPTEEWLPVREKSWTAAGQTLLQRLCSEIDGVVVSAPGTAVRLHVPSSVEHGKADDHIMGETSASPAAGVTEDSKGSETDQKPDQPEKSDAAAKDVPDGEQNEPASATTDDGKKPTTTTLPTRKRSTEMAELPENAEGGRIRSKRIRARESILEEAQNPGGKGLDFGPELNEKIQASTDADQWLFEVVNELVRKIGINPIPNAQDIRDLVSPGKKTLEQIQSLENPLQQPIKDFYQAMQNWTSEKSHTLTQQARAADSSSDARNEGLLAFLEYSKARYEDAEIRREPLGLEEFVEEINGGTMNTGSALMHWLWCLLANRNEPDFSQDVGVSTSYQDDAWTDSLKEVLVRVITNSSIDDYLQEKFEHSIAVMNTDQDDESLSNKFFFVSTAIRPEMVQSLFELHLDVYSSITNPASTVAAEIRLQQKERLKNWFNLAHEAMGLFHEYCNPILQESLLLRHFWTTVFSLNATGDVTHEHVVACIEDLKKHISISGQAVLRLPNNAVMPEISATAADRELSKLETTGFFLGVFQGNNKHPVDLIETLEPILERTVQREVKVETNAEVAVESPSLSDSADRVEEDTIANGTSIHSSGHILAKFLERTPSSLRLLLWDRLEEAYELIDYPPKLFSICFRKIELLLGDLTKDSYTDMKAEDREKILLERVHDLSDLLSKAIKICESQPNAFECIDGDHLKTSLRQIINVWLLLQAVSLFDDYSQIGQRGGSTVNPFRFYASDAFHPISIKLHEMQVQVSILMYKMFVEAMREFSEHFETPQEDRLAFLRCVHYALGARRLCKASDSLFLKFMKKQLMDLPKLEGQASDDLAQILYDMYDLSCFSTALMKQSHGCDADYLDRNTAMDLIDFVMDKASKVAIKDLVKSDLGKSIEKLHSSLGALKSNSSVTAARNRVVYLAFIKSAVTPLDLYRSLEGLGNISTAAVNRKDALVASKGWYLLKGRIALSKANAQRSKGAAGSAEDIQDAISFLITDLEYSTENWETWYRLGQAHDALLEEQVLWSAEKINLQPAEVAQTQRAAIHAYIMAVATMLRNEEPSEDTIKRMSELCTEFGNRIYSSTRDPFDMRPFSNVDLPEKNVHLNGGPAVMAPLKPLDRASAWQFAGALFKKASASSQNWVNHYMIAKCLWKLHQRQPKKSKEQRWVPALIKHLLRAVETAPARKDANRQDPLLEPIYKTVSIVHKLVLKGDLRYREAEDYIRDCLNRQKQFEVTKKLEREEGGEWSPYVLEILRMLRSADKSKWHHRLVFRAAHVMYEINSIDGTGAKIAKEYLLEQHMYSAKTLAWTVWKPEQERAGRHWVYMTSYARFLAKLLEETNDLEALQMLTRRVRKKANEYYDHAPLWDDVVAAFLRVHRKYAKIPENHCDHIFHELNQDEFAARSAWIEQWITDSKLPPHPLRTVICEVAEIRKLNGGLIKATGMEELLADTYAAVWVEVGPSPKELAPKASPSTSNLSPAPPTREASVEPPKRDPMSLNNLMNVDGASEPRSTPQPPALTIPGAAGGDLTVHRSRPRLISRREIVKRASDAVFSKPLPSKTTSPTTKSGRRSSVASAKAEKNSREGSEAAEVPSSVPASVHDSADDESELSEPDDDDDIIIVKSMFPNLKPSQPSALVRGGGGAKDDQDMGEGEAEEDANGDEEDVDEEQDETMSNAEGPTEERDGDGDVEMT